MAAGARWQKLPSFPNLPALYASAAFESSSYVIHITDLANVWVERLDRRSILKRSLTEDTSIDLIDGDPTQWSLFHQKLGLALDPTEPDHHLTTLEIAASSDNPAHLTLHITCVLPEPLKPLKWPLYLAKCTPSEMASEVVIPLVRAQQARAHEMDDLVTKLKQKDAIIAKLVDKLEALGSGLDHVFNPLSGKRKISRSAAEEKVDGLAPFQASGWQMTPSVFNTDDENNFSGTILLNDWWSNLSALPKAAIKNTDTKSSKPRKSQERSQSVLKATNDDDDDDDDDFQVQSTPPHLRVSRNKPNHGSATAIRGDDDSTDDGEDSPKKSEDIPTREKPRARLGAIGNKKKSPPAQTPQTTTTKANMPVSHDDDTASEIDPDETMGDPDETMGPGPESEPESDAEPASRAEPSPKPKRSTGGGIGAIGGGKKKSPAPAASSPLPASDVDGEDGDETASGSDDFESDNEPHLPKRLTTEKPTTASSAPPPKRGAIGQIGRRPNKAPAAPAIQDDAGETSKSPSPPPPSPKKKKPTTHAIGSIGGRRAAAEDTKRAAPTNSSDSGTLKQQKGEQEHEEDDEDEDDRQKADRRRAELEKQLEKKKKEASSSAAPARKKRRF